MTSYVPLGDPKHGGALFVLPREIRDEIYRLLVKGSYLDTGCFYRYPDKGFLARNDVQPDFAILQLSKSIGREATEILYSESVFRFVITTRRIYEEDILSPDLDRMKRLAPMTQNVVLDVDHSFDRPDPFCEINMDIAVQNFGGLDITRRSLLVRMWQCSQSWFKEKGSTRVCQQLKAFLGFRAATLEVLPTIALLLGPFIKFSEVDDGKYERNIRKEVARIAQAVAEELEPVLGPAVSGFRCHTGIVPLPNCNLKELLHRRLIGYLEFHSNKHSVENQVAKEDQVQ